MKTIKEFAGHLGTLAYLMNHDATTVAEADDTMTEEACWNLVKSRYLFIAESSLMAYRQMVMLEQEKSRKEMVEA